MSLRSRETTSDVRCDRLPLSSARGARFCYFSPPRRRRRKSADAFRNRADAFSRSHRRSREKLRPTAEIAKARAKVFHAKLRVRELFKDLEYPEPHANAKKIARKPAIDADGEATAVDAYDSDSGIDAEDIYCTICGEGDADDDDDILLCDGFCEGAYHMSCMDPPVTARELAQTHEDDDWMCRVCDARVDAFYALNAIVDTHVDAATATWRDVFPEEAALFEAERGPGQANDPARGANGENARSHLLDEDWASDESDDEDFGGAGSLSDDGADDEDEPLSGSARHSDVDSDGDSGDEGTSEVLHGKRRRAPVDYRKLNDEMFGTGEAFEGEAEDEKTGGWGPASPKKKRKLDCSSSRASRKSATIATSAKKDGVPSATKAARRVSKRARASESGKKKTPSSGTKTTDSRRFPDATRGALERAFASDARPSAARVSALESELGISRHQIKVWFQNRRRKEKA